MTEVWLLKDLVEVEGIIDLPSAEKVVLKPNLINSSPPPTTTAVDIVEFLARYYHEEGYEVVVAEGSGWVETEEAYKRLGYKRLEKYAKLVDLNHDDFKIKRNQRALFLREFEFPLTLEDSYIISIPVLKEHSITKVSLSLKNMLGATLGERGRIAKKGRFHKSLDESIVDINIYLKPSLAVIDGRVAGLGGELHSKPRKMDVIVVSRDLVAADAVAASLLGLNPLSIGHLKLAAERGLGTADLNEIEVKAR
jgi:uncharacterized protein (DUF362 family)